MNSVIAKDTKHSAAPARIAPVYEPKKS